MVWFDVSVFKSVDRLARLFIVVQTEMVVMRDAINNFAYGKIDRVILVIYSETRLTLIHIFEDLSDGVDRMTLV